MFYDKIIQNGPALTCTKLLTYLRLCFIWLRHKEGRKPFQNFSQQSANWDRRALKRVGRNSKAAASQVKPIQNIGPSAPTTTLCIVLWALSADRGQVRCQGSSIVLGPLGAEILGISCQNNTAWGGGLSEALVQNMVTPYSIEWEAAWCSETLFWEKTFSTGKLHNPSFWNCKCLVMAQALNSLSFLPWTIEQWDGCANQQTNTARRSTTEQTNIYFPS